MARPSWMDLFLEGSGWLASFSAENIICRREPCYGHVVEDPTGAWDVGVNERRQGWWLDLNIETMRLLINTFETTMLVFGLCACF